MKLANCAGIALIGFAISLSATAAVGTVKASIRACVADLDFPPYVYSVPGPAGTRPALVGLAIDVLQNSLQNLGYPSAKIERLPWNRCLALTEHGQVDLILNVPTAQIDPTPFYISDPYAHVHSVYFYSRKIWPKGINIGNFEDLKHFHICGLLGNRFEAYGINTAKVDTGSYTYDSLIGKLIAGHCDLFLDKREVIAALASRDEKLRLALNSPDLQEMPLAEDVPIGLHFAIGRNMPGGETLLLQINASITALQKNGQLEKWLASYLDRFGSGSKSTSDPANKK